MENPRNESAQGLGETKLWKKASTQFVNPRPGQPAQCSSLYDQQSSRDQQQRYAPPPSYTPQTQPLPGSVQQGYSAQPLAYGYTTGQQVIVQAPPPLPAVS
ncbi:hypothetical protein EB796_003612 [Bugula neritina]|uniref:Uncharacterized protein n=1 Tax=Bugula neritina TaxID=10212 RepID=A0A7J7KJI1_BUGNE|nr:hypothetical protein EB796_003612 [Bugula neritina]